MKDTTKETLSFVVDLTWDLIKFASSVIQDNVEYSALEAQEEEREAERERKRQENEKFKQSLSPNERKIYEKVEDLENENHRLRSAINAMTMINDELRDQVSSLESKINE